MSNGTVIFEDYNKKTSITIGNSILAAANSIGVEISASCGGLGLCGKCRIQVKAGAEHLEQISPFELQTLSKAEINRGYRLACTSILTEGGTVQVRVPVESKVEQFRLQLAGIETPVPLHPTVKRHVVSLKKPTLEHPTSTVEVLTESLGFAQKPSIDFDALKKLPWSVSQGEWVVTAYVYDQREIIKVTPGRAVTGTHGLAVDIGSTKIAAFVVSLDDGKVIASASAPNPQINFGDDIISRISYASKSEQNLKQLQTVVVAAINMLILKMCHEAKIEPSDICDTVAVGNTVMHHIFLGIDPQLLARSPYQPNVRESVTIPSRDLGLRVDPGARIYLPPIIAGYVGADATADILATGIYKSPTVSLLIDVGTNTEVVLGNTKRLAACSCASGPALEGGCIECGMRAETGAIEQVYIDPRNLEPGYKTIGGTEPRGICGSGIVDAIASMLKCGIIDSRGKIHQKPDTRRVRTRNAQTEFVLVWSEDTQSHARDLAISQRDVQQIQLAKAAIYSAVSILMKRLRITADEIGRVFLAGAFGTYVDPRSALILGMYPDIDRERIQFVGNSAGSGARMALLSKDVRLFSEEFARQIEYVELAADPDFSREFTEALCIPHRNVALFPSVNELIRTNNPTASG